MGRRKKLHRRIVPLHLRLLRSLYGLRPVPFGYWQRAAGRLAAAFRVTDPLLPPLEPLMSTGADLRTESLRHLLSKDQLGAWALDVETIEFLWEQVHRDRPTTMIEFGAGSSSLLLTSYAAGVTSGQSPFVVSIEQDYDYKIGVERRLHEHGLAGHISIIHTPVAGNGMYAMDADAIAALLGSRTIDWIIIDGPSGPEGCRVSTIPAIARFCRPGARWFLDDAFRDGEMEILRQWNGMKGIEVEGIYPVGKGLATGTVSDPSAVVAAGYTAAHVVMEQAL